MYVHIGSHCRAPDGWENFDASPTLRFEKLPVVGRLYSKNGWRFPRNVRYGDIVAALPLPDQSCDGAYASHVLEHLALEDLRKALVNIFRLLKAGGVFRLVVPDLEAEVRRYLDALARGDADAAPAFMRDTGLGQERRPRGVAALLQSWLGNSRHLWLWDQPSLTAELGKAGFVSIRRCQCGDAADGRFAELEDQARFTGALALECRRPLLSPPSA
jgi:SAM-dependent methyltransferase